MRENIAPSPVELSTLIFQVYNSLEKFNEYDELPNVDYDTAGVMQKYAEAVCGQTKVHGRADFDTIIEIFEKAKSKLAQSAALNVYKKARAAVHDMRYGTDDRDRLWNILEEIKRKKRNGLGATHDIVGSREVPNRWIYSYENGPFIREVNIQSRKKGMKPLEIVQFTDVHFNYCNQRDMKEANPALMSTLEKRLWLRNAASVPTTRKSMAYAAMSDQTIVTGDILDYLSWGAIELTQKELFWQDTNMLACLGGHDVTRVMQGCVADNSTSESRFQIVKEFWCNDISYASRILGDRVLAVVMDNGANMGYTKAQYDYLKSDIEYARKNALIILIFQHEGLCTGNPLDNDIEYVRVNDKNSRRDFANLFIGSKMTTDESTLKTYALIRKSSDVIEGVFCGHHHSDFYTEILGTDEKGNLDGSIIPQYVLTANVYDDTGHIIKITID